jgi:hypothetical protein
MSALQPCTICPRRRGACEIRDGKRAAIKGLGLTLARFSCDAFHHELRAGRRVIAKITAGHLAYTGHYGADNEYDDVLVKATIVYPYSTSSRRVVVWPDDEHHEYLNNMKHEGRFAKIRPSKVFPLDEPDDPARVTAWEAAYMQAGATFEVDDPS